VNNENFPTPKSEIPNPPIDSTIPRFNGLTILFNYSTENQQFNDSTVQRFNGLTEILIYSTFQLFNETIPI